MATYDNDLRLKEITTGDEDGTWGTSTNLNLELIGEALSYGTQDCFASDADATTTVADSATDPARSMYFKVTSSATLTATRTLTIAPNTISRVMWIENATTGSQSITISQGSGGNVTIPTGDVKVVYLDGAGSGAAVVDAFTNLNLADVSSLVATTVDINGGSIDGTIIGAASPAAGTFTTATATTGAITTVNSTTVNATTVDATSVEVTNVKAKDGTASATIADSTGVMTISSSVLTTADINGGTIDGTVIGGTTPAAINGTVVTGTTSGVFASDMTITAGSIVSASGAITFGNENLSTTGTLGAGVATLASSSTVGNLTLANGSITDSSGAITFGNENLVTTGTLGAGVVTGTQMLVNVDNPDLVGWVITAGTGTNACAGKFTNTGGNLYVGLDNSAGSRLGGSYAGAFWHEGNYPLLFGTNNTERMRIDSSGNVVIVGGIYLGGTVAANLLDDYEEGTWTSAGIWVTQGTGSSAGTPSAQYTKVGNAVSVIATVILTKGTASGAFTIGTLPFTNGSLPSACALRTSGIGSASNVLQAMVNASSTVVAPQLAPQNSTTHGADLTASDMKADSYFFFSCTYLT
jgi:hypothetical protein